jgi:hypothetical protein
MRTESNRLVDMMLIPQDPPFGLSVSSAAGQVNISSDSGSHFSIPEAACIWLSGDLSCGAEAIARTILQRLMAVAVRDDSLVWLEVRAKEGTSGLEAALRVAVPVEGTCDLANLAADW